MGANHVLYLMIGAFPFCCPKIEKQVNIYTVGIMPANIQICPNVIYFIETSVYYRFYKPIFRYNFIKYFNG